MRVKYDLPCQHFLHLYHSSLSIELLAVKGIPVCSIPKTQLGQKIAKDLWILILLVWLFHLLNTIANGDLYMSHNLSRNNKDDGDLEVMIFISESWRMEYSSRRKLNQSLMIEDTMEMISSLWLNRNCAGLSE